MWQMLQQEEADDFVIATGKSHSVREFVEMAGRYIDMEIEWEGEGVDEVGIDRKTGKKVVEIDPRYFRPAEVETLLGDSSKAKAAFGWEAQMGLEELVGVMMKHDLEEAKKK